MENLTNGQINYKKLNMQKLFQLVSDEVKDDLIKIIQNDLIYEILDAGMTALRIEAHTCDLPIIEATYKTYIIRVVNTNKIKIGKSYKPLQRVRTLSAQSGHELEILCVIDKDIELSLHKQFENYRTLGEWFEDTDGLIKEFASTENIN